MGATRNELLNRMFSMGVQLERYTPHSRNVRGGWRISEGGIIAGMESATYRPVGQVDNWLQLAMAKDAGVDIWWITSGNILQGKMKVDDWNFPASLRYSIGHPVGEEKGNCDEVSVPPTPTIGGKIHDAIELLNRHGYVVTRSPS